MTAEHPDPYPTRIVTFIDILGFTRDVVKLDQNLALYQSIDAVLRHVATCKRDIDRKRQQPGGVRFDHRMTQFSDCVLMSYENVPGASLRAIADAAFIGQVILRPGYLPRGAITLARLVQDDAVAFGRGLIDAYKMESAIVKTPRIALTTDVLQLVKRDLAREQPTDQLGMYVRDRSSGPFVHILGQDWPFHLEMREKVKKGIYASDGVEEMYEEIHHMLPVRHADAPDEKAAAKCEWMRRYVNDAIDEYGLPQKYKVVFAPRPFPSLAHRLGVWLSGVWRALRTPI
jgi:hypothetical protein